MHIQVPKSGMSVKDEGVDFSSSKEYVSAGVSGHIP
jgi:hypothetical protein